MLRNIGIALLLSCLPALLPSGAGAEDPLDHPLIGTWEGSGTLFGNDATFQMQWEWVLGDQFVHLTFQNSMPGPDGTDRIMTARAFYKPAGGGRFEGTWFDSRGVVQPLQGSVDGPTLTVLWGTPETEQGRTTYTRPGPNEVTVEDEVLKSGEWHSFGRATYQRIGETPASAMTATEWFLRAQELYEAGQFAESSDHFRKSIDAGAQNPNTFYNAACAAALAGRPDLAFEHLDGALARGFREVEMLSKDSDFQSVRKDERWSGIVERCRQADADFIASLMEPELREELLEMRRIDQSARRGEDIPELAGRGMGDVDAVHTARMKEIIAEHGWPTANLVGEDGARSAWLLVQHADADPEFQRVCLDLMKAAPEGQVSPVDVAYLTDRVLVNEGKKQLYGTQFWSVNGEMVPRPIEDEAGLEARRADVGMISMREYTRRMTGR